jgi:hypothetical protein
VAQEGELEHGQEAGDELRSCLFRVLEPREGESCAGLDADVGV